MFQKTYKFKNTRQYKRLKADYLIKYKFAGSEEESWVANIKDISASGVRFWSSPFIPEGALLKIEILVPPIGITLEVLGRIIRVRASGKENPIFYMAVRFIEVSAEQQDVLNGFIEDLLRRNVPQSVVPHAEVVERKAIVKEAL